MDLIGLKELDTAQFLQILDLADDLVEARLTQNAPQFSINASEASLNATQASINASQVSINAPQTSVALVFFEPSTRTRVSFELAAARLGLHTIRVGSGESSAQKGESAVETCRNLEAMGIGALVLRTREPEAPYQVRERVNIPVINAGNGNDEHPTQALIDALTLRRAFARRGEAIAGKRVAIIGDIAHSRVARSDLIALKNLGCEVILAGPASMMPDTEMSAQSPGTSAGEVFRDGFFRENAFRKDIFQKDSLNAPWPAEVAPDREAALAAADAVIMLRVQRERFDAEGLDSEAYPARYQRDWGIDADIARRAMKPGAFVLHPGPVIHGMELSREVADGPQSLILEQVSYGVSVRQAVLLYCLERAYEL